MIKTVSTQELSKALGIERHKIKLMCELGMLTGIRTGRGWRFAESEAERFWEEYKGEDLSNAEKIRFAADMHRAKKANDHR